MDKEIINILAKHGCKHLAYDYKDLLEEVIDFVKKREQAINYSQCCTQFNALLQKETEVIYKGIKYYVFLIDYNKETASIKQVDGTWIEYNIPFKQLTKSI